MALDIRTLLILTGLTGIHSITTVSKVTVRAGRSVSIPCLYDRQYTNNVKYLCKGSAWLSCSYVVKTNQPSSGKFSISDDKDQRIFTVTIKDLTPPDTDYYWCAVEIKDGPDPNQYLHLSVTTGTPGLYVKHQQVTGFIGGSITISCLHHNSGNMKWCRLGSSCVSRPSDSIYGTKVTIDKSVSGVFTVTMSGLRTDSSGWYWCVKGDLQMPVYLTVTEKPTTTTSATTTYLPTTANTTESVIQTSDIKNTTVTIQDGKQRGSVDLKTFIIPLSILILIVMVALFVCFMLKKQKPTKAAAMTAAEEDMTYTNVVDMRQISGQRFQTESDVNVIYSSVASKKKKNVPKVEASADDVTYSTLAFGSSTF